MKNEVKQLTTLATAPKKKQVVCLKLTEVKSKASQVRKVFSEIASLAHSILQEGQIQPIVVSAKNAEGYYVIQQGERRWRACQQAELAEIEAIISDKTRSDLDEIAGELIENIQREALSPMEIANALRCFVDEGWQQKEIAKRLGKNSSFVSTHLSLLKLPGCVVALYQADVTHDIETLNNLRLLFELAPEKCRGISQAALQKGITRQQSRERFNEAKQLAGKPKKTAKSAEKPKINPVDCLPTQTVPTAVAVGHPNRDGDLEACSTSMSTSVHDSHEGATIPPQETTTAAAGGWRAVDTDKLCIVINVLCDADFQHGVMMTDRVDSDPDYIWVKITRGGQEKTMRVPATDIELVRVVAQG